MSATVPPLAQPLVASWVFPTACPQCGQRAGNPIAVSDATPNLIIVTIRCSHCDHAWDVHAEQPPIILIPKPDRRKPNS